MYIYIYIYMYIHTHIDIYDTYTICTYLLVTTSDSFAACLPARARCGSPLSVLSAPCGEASWPCACAQEWRLYKKNVLINLNV